MVINKYKNKIKNRKIQEIKTPRHFHFPQESFAVHMGDQVRFGIICGPIWGSFPVWGSFAALYRTGFRAKIHCFTTPINFPARFPPLLSKGPQNTKKDMQMSMTELRSD